MLVGDIEEPVVAAATRTPFESARRVFVIEGADAMNDQAANRMLKTLEEPPPFVHLLLLTDRREDVLATIASRCQHVRFDPLPPARIAARLQGVEPERARACARLALGDARLAARLASEEGEALRAGAEALRALGPARRRPASGRWTGLLDVAKAAGAAAGERSGERLRAGARAGAEQGAQTLRARRARRPGAAASGARARRRSISRCAWRSCGCATCCASSKAPPELRLRRGPPRRARARRARARRRVSARGRRARRRTRACGWR